MTQKDEVNVYIWDGFEPSYTDGLAFAIAETLEEAQQMVLDQHKIQYNANIYDWGIRLTIKPIMKMCYLTDGGD